jgi:ribosomal-protein-alanine N-acetyltransferase
MTSLIAITEKNYPFYIEPIHEIERLSFSCPWSLESFKAEIKNPVSHLWVLRTGGMISTYICFWMIDSEIQVVNFAVHPDLRGRGLGSFLLAQLIRSGISNRVHSVWLEVRQSNDAAKGLYKKLGFREIDRRLGYYPETREDALVMSLNLPKRDM